MQTENQATPIESQPESNDELTALGIHYQDTTYTVGGCDCCESTWSSDCGTNGGK